MRLVVCVDGAVVTFVGLVRDTKYSSVKKEIPPVFFVPHRQQSDVGDMNFYVRTAGEPTAMLRAMSQLIDEVLGRLPG